MEKSFSHILALGLLLLAVTSCSGEKAFDGVNSLAVQMKGYIIVSTVVTDPSTGPGMVSIFKPDGTFVSTIRDHFVSTNQWTSGIVFVPPNEVLLAVGLNGASRIERVNLNTGTLDNFYTGVRISGNPNREMVRAFDGSIFLAEQTANSIEKFDKHGLPIGNTFIGTTTTTGAVTCTLTNPWGLAIIPADSSNPERLVAISNAAAGRLSVYNAADGTCIANTALAPFTSGTPTAVAYHKTTQKLLITFATTNTIWACAVDGTGCVQVWNTSGTLLNVPRAITVDEADNIYISSSGNDTIYKFTWSGGTNQLSIVGSGALVGPSSFTNNPISIRIIE